MHEKERRLYDEFEMFCKYYCKYKGKSEFEINDSDEYDGYCYDCTSPSIVIKRFNIYPCDYCQVGEYIRHIRDVI